MDQIIQELAHEFKNPMVTIKTFAHQIDQLLVEGSEHEEFARFTGEAVERMDAALENLVQYTRFQDPSREPTSLGAVVSAALGGVREYVAEKELALDVEQTASQVMVDPAQCGYAVRTLLRTVVRDLSRGDALALRSIGPGSLAIEYPAPGPRSAANSLARLVSGDSRGNDGVPLGFSIARTLIERNAGRLVLGRDGDIARVTITRPLPADEKDENGETQGSGRR